MYAAGEADAADTCVASQMKLLTAQLAALQEFQSARRSAPAVAPGISGCVVDANGASICLPAAAQDGAAGNVTAPATAAECGSEATALELLAGLPAPVEPSRLDSFIVESSQRRWWAAARRAVNDLRAQNAPAKLGQRALTEIRDEAGDLLVLIRQTKMDEATINCAVMWAQGESMVHLNVKFASRLDAPVTVLNVDNEKVAMNESHVSFSAIGRQKPKHYIMDLELYAAIDPNASSWNFAGVGTVRLEIAVDFASRRGWLMTAGTLPSSR